MSFSNRKRAKFCPWIRIGTNGALYAAAVATSLQQVFEAPGISTKTIMGWTSASERTVKGWAAGSYGPRGEHLVALMRSSDLVLKCVLYLANREALLDVRRAGCLAGAITRSQPDCWRTRTVDKRSFPADRTTSRKRT